ncbi:hypothetical protein ABW21_db0204695 [Orbilia brochopaga]|nr:hypothetical protein ABW21_db0204695 [Drechslerella brochopaga]
MHDRAGETLADGEQEDGEKDLNGLFVGSSAAAATTTFTYHRHHVPPEVLSLRIAQVERFVTGALGSLQIGLFVEHNNHHSPS